MDIKLRWRCCAPSSFRVPGVIERIFYLKGVALGACITEKMTGEGCEGPRITPYSTRIFQGLIYFSSYLIFAFLALFFYLLARILTLFFCRGKRQRVARYVMHLGARILVWGLRCVKFMNVNVNVKAQDESTCITSSHIVVANHPSMLDAIFILSVVPNGICIMKSSILKLPIISGFARLAGYILQSTGPGLIAASIEALEDGGTLIIFPEGTRSSQHGLGEFKRGASWIAAKTGLPVAVFGVRMTPVVLGRATPWWRVPRFPVRYEAVRIDTAKVEITGMAQNSEGFARNERSNVIQFTKWLEDRIGNWVSSERRLS